MGVSRGREKGRQGCACAAREPWKGDGRLEMRDEVNEKSKKKEGSSSAFCVMVDE